MSTTNISEPEKLLAWINSLLKAEYEKIEHLGNGAAYCQLIDMLFPQAMISMRDVNFSTTVIRESRQNFNQLRKALVKMRIRKVVLTQHLIRGSYEENLSFLKWFKVLFDKNNTNREYDVVAQRNGSRMGCVQSADKAKAKLESKSKTVVLKNSQGNVPEVVTEATAERKKTNQVEELLDAIAKVYSKSEPINQKLPEVSELDSKANPDGIQVSSQTGKFALLAIPEEVCEKISKLASSTKNAGLSTEGEIHGDMELQSKLKSSPEGTSKMVLSSESSSVMEIPNCKGKRQVSVPKNATVRKEVPKKSIEVQKKSNKVQDKSQRVGYMMPKEPISLNYLTRPQQIAHMQKIVVNIGRNMVAVGQERDIFYGKLKDIEKICLDFQNSSQNSENSSHGRGVIEAIKKSVSDCLDSEHAK